MCRQNKCSVAIALCMCLFVGAGVASAWEFSMTGDWTWEYKLYSQMGDNGFFGKFNTSNNATGDPGDGASFNGWLGNEITFDSIVSGADAAASSMYTHFKPEIRINEAVRLRGTYYIGSWVTPTKGGVTGVGSYQAPEYFTGTIGGVQSSFSPGYWNLFWATAQTPWGIVALGKRPFSFGTGLILDGEDNTTYEGLLFVVPYGPFRLGGAWMPWTQGSQSYGVLADKSAVQSMRVGGFVTYDSGPMSAGAITEFITWHGGPESQAAQADRRDYVPNDSVLNYMTAFVKYNNGRFFFNAEGTYIKVDTHNQRNLSGLDNDYLGAPGGNHSAFAPAYIDHARYMAEFGVFSGPAKLTLLWSYVEGGVDRRNGIAIDRQADTRSLPGFSNYSVFRPYSILWAWNYGSGNGSYTSRGAGPGVSAPNASMAGSDNGYVTDANVYAARLDHAVAANLNVYGSFVWAERLSKGYGWGYIHPTSTTNPLVDYSYKGGSTGVGNVAPAIPDNALGYEVDWGFDWQLLEGYTISTAFGYWVPGKWFSYACVDRRAYNWDSAPGTGPYVTNGGWGVSPNRAIDPVFGMDVQVKVEF